VKLCLVGTVVFA